MTVEALFRRSPVYAAEAASLYLIRAEDLDGSPFLVYGLTRELMRRRVSRYRQAGIEPVLLVEHRTDLLSAARVEGLLRSFSIRPATEFNGSTECLPCCLCSVRLFVEAVSEVEASPPSHPDSDWCDLYVECRARTRRLQVS